MACNKVYCGCHPGDSGAGVGNHPQQYFNASTTYWSAKKEKEGDVGGAGGLGKTSLGMGGLAGGAAAGAALAGTKAPQALASGAVPMDVDEA